MGGRLTKRKYAEDKKIKLEPPRGCQAICLLYDTAVKRGIPNTPPRPAGRLEQSVNCTIENPEDCSTPKRHD